MSKTKWHTKAFHLIIALVVTVGLLMVPATAGANPDVTVTQANAPDMLAGNAADGLCPTWTQIGGTQPMVITENAVGDISVGNIVLRAPTGFEFNTAVLPDVAVTGGGTLTATSPAAVTQTTITITVTAVSTGTAPGTITIGGVTPIEARPLNVDPLAQGPICMDDTASTATVLGVNPCGAPGETLFAVLKEVVGGWLEPDIAYNVKTADETFTVIDAATGQPIEPCGDPPATTPSTQNWVVTQGCGFAGTLSVVAGGADGDNSITVRMVEPGDAIVTVEVDFDCDGCFETVLDAEKKWGEISNTDLWVYEDTPGDENFRGCDWVQAYFWWDMCMWMNELDADGAKMTWWLIEYNPTTLADIEAIEGCYPWNIDGRPDPEPIIENLYLTNPAVDAHFDQIGDPTKVVTTSGDGGLTGLSEVDIDAPTAPENVMLVVLTEYPLDKNGQNTECVEWARVYVPPPPPDPLTCDVTVDIDDPTWQEEVTFDVTVSGGVGSYTGTLDFGDGSPVENITGSCEVTHTYHPATPPVPETFTVELDVEDSQTPPDTCHSELDLDVHVAEAMLCTDDFAEGWPCTDIAFNVKSASETFCVYDSVTGRLLPSCYIKKWDVLAGLGITMADIDITDPAGTPVNPSQYTGPCLVVTSAKVGDCHVKVFLDMDKDGSYEEILTGEKKWGEIECTELESEELAADFEYGLTDTVIAWFMWGPTGEVECLPADDAIVNWFLMDVSALADVEALEAALGPCGMVCCPIDEDDCGCGNYAPGFFEYDGVLYDDPFDALQAIQADNLVNPGESWIIGSADPDYTWNTSDVLGEATIDIHAESPTGVMVATLVEYGGSGFGQGVDYHGENVECVEHETFVPPPPPPTVEKFPLIAWVGEKTVVEWNVGEEYAGYLVTWASEIPYSVGVLETEIDGPDTEVDGLVDDDGVARCIVHSDKSGKTNMIARLWECPDDDTPDSEQAFIVYWIAFYDVQLRNMEDYHPANPDWDTPGNIEDLLEVGETTTLRVRVSGYFIDPDPEFQSTRLETWIDTDGDGTPDLYLPRGWWKLPDDWNALAGGALWQLQKPHWDLMDELDDDIMSTSWGEWGDYNVGGDVNSPSGVADCPVVGPFSTAQPWDEDQWITTPAAVIADDLVSVEAPCTSEDLRTTVVPNHNCNLFDAVMPPARMYIIADEGILSTVDKGDIYYIGSPKSYTFPYYKQEIPRSWLIDPNYGAGPTGYRWDSWDVDVAAPLTVKGPYDNWEALDLWAYDYDAMNDIFDYDLVLDDPRLLSVFTDNHGEAYVDFMLDEVETEATINAIACYPAFVGDFNSVISNDVDKWTLNLKDIKIAWETIDDMTDMLYVFIRDYDGDPATEDLLDFNRDGVDGSIVDCLPGTTGWVLVDGSAAWDVTTREMTVDEIAYFEMAEISTPLDRWNRQIVTTGDREWLFDLVTEFPEDYAIAGIEVVSSLCEPVDIIILIHDIFDGEWVEDFGEDQILQFCLEPTPTEDVDWVYLAGYTAFISPYESQDRPELTLPAACDEIGMSLVGAWFQVYYQDPFGNILWYDSMMGGTLDVLDPEELYWVVTSAPMTLTIPQVVV